MKKATLLILAAGMGSRYGGLKQVDPLGPSGETIMDYSIYDAVKAGFTKVVFVVREFFKEEFEKNARAKYSKLIDIEFVCQELEYVPEGSKYNTERVKPWGTCHAVMMAAKAINEPFAVINADDFYGADSFKTLANFLFSVENKEFNYSMVGFKIFNTLSESGGVSRGICSVNKDNFLTSAEEHHKIEAKNNIIEGINSNDSLVQIDKDSLVSMNMWGFTPDFFKESEKSFVNFLADKGDKLDSEFYIPFVVNEMLKDNKATVKVLQSDDEWFGVTYKEDRDMVVAKIKKLVEQGKYPTPLTK